MKKTILISLICIMSFVQSSFSQDYWKAFRKADGLADSVVLDMAVNGDKVYLATRNGFSIFENEQFTNYDTSNSNMADQHVQMIRQFNDTVYMITDSGLTQFANGVFTNYDSTDGLISKTISDIEVDSKGTLWIASAGGLGKKVGNTFINDTTKVVYDIGINSGDSIYANVNFRTIANLASPITAELYVNGVWSTLRDTSLTFAIQTARFMNLSNGRVGIISSNEGAFIIDSVFSLRQIELPSNDIPINALSGMDIDSKSNYWFSMGSFVNFLPSGGVYRYANDTIETYVNGLHNRGVTTIKHSNGKIYLGTFNGLAVASDSIKVYARKSTIETNSVKATVAYNGYLFNDPTTNSTNNLSDFAGFEFPKGSQRHLMYGSGLWLSSRITDSSQYTAITSLQRNDFRSGSYSDNGTTVAPSVITISKSEISFHLKNYNKPGYVMPESIRNWHANGRVELGEAAGQAPFVDVNNNGCYDPENGDYPSILGDKAIYISICDDTPVIKDSKDFRFRTDVQIVVYVYDLPSAEYLDRTIFVRYNLVNRSKRIYRNVHMGILSDFDVGGASDDAPGCDLSSNSYFAYNADFNDESTSSTIGYGLYSPFIGVKYINHTLSGHISFYNNPSNSNQSNPRLPSEYANNIHMLWRNGVPISEGGNGYNVPPTTITNYLFPGRLDKTDEWSYLNPGFNFGPVFPGDIRSLGRISFDQWQPNERKVVDLLYTVGQDSANINTYDNYLVMLDNMEKAARFQQGIDSITPSGAYASCITSIDENNYNKVQEVVIYPNPTSGEINLLVDEVISEVVVYDLNGRVVVRQSYNEAQKLQSISLPFGLQNGLYIVRVLTVQNNWLSKQLLLQR